MQQSAPMGQIFNVVCVGSHVPLEAGKPGYAVSACSIQNPETGEWDDKVFVGREPNRYHWLACVNSLLCPAQELPASASARVVVTSKDIKDVFERKGLKKCGKPAAEYEAWQALFTTLQERNVSLELHVDGKDKQAKRLKAKSKKEALEEWKLANSRLKAAA